MIVYIYEEKSTAERHDSARSLPDETLTLWMNTLKRLAPIDQVPHLLDLGGGTGRFARSLSAAYRCHVTAIDPSEAMLRQGVNSLLILLGYTAKPSTSHLPTHHLTLSGCRRFSIVLKISISPSAK